MPAVIKERQWKRRKLWAEQIKDTLSQTLQEITLKNSPNSETPNIQIEDVSTKDIDVCDKETLDTADHIVCKNNTQTDGSSTLVTHEEDQNKEEIKNVENSPKSCVKDNLSNAQDIEESNQMDVDQKENSTDHQDTISIFNRANVEVKCKDEMSTYQSFLQSQEDQNNEVLVLADSDDENFENVLQNPQPHLENEEVKTVVETLNLTLEEAFFLSFGLGCLQVNDIFGQEMSLTQQWQTFSKVKPNFIESYVCYHHFRAKGWVVKSGYKFGGDFRKLPLCLLIKHNYNLS